MLTPIFTHGTYANTQKAIDEGKLKYPAYCWCSDVQQYGFVNKDNKLEIIGIPELAGTAQDMVILSTLNDGIYQVSGQYTITADYPTIFLSTSDDLCIVQTIDEKKIVKRITANEIANYVIEDDLSVTTSIVATQEWIKEQGYADEEYIDYKMEILKHELEDEIDELVRPVVKPICEEVIDETIQPIDDQDIESLFNN